MEERFGNMRLPGCTAKEPLRNPRRESIHIDAHSCIELLLADYQDKVVCGYSMIIEGQRHEIMPMTDNGLYNNERNAKIYMVAKLQTDFCRFLSPEILRVLHLYEWQLRQRNLF